MRFGITVHVLLFLASAEENHDSSDKEEGGEIQLEMVELTLGTLHLREFEIHPSGHRRRRRRKKEETKVENEGMSGPVCRRHIGGYNNIMPGPHFLCEQRNLLLYISVPMLTG